MNTGMNLEELARELTRRTDPNVRRDFVTPQGKIEMVPGSEGGVKLAGLPLQAHAAIRPHAHGQIADELGIPKKYYDRMLVEKPELLARNVNTWLHAAPTAKRMVRTLDGEARAVLSSSYRPLDNHDLAQAALPILATRKAQVVSSALTETRMYIKAILPELSDEIPEGLQLGVGHNALRKDTVIAGIVISNSEVGSGAVRVEPMVFKTRCTNLLIISESKLRKYHIGRDQGLDMENVEELLASRTRTARDQAFWMTVRDVVAAAFDVERFRAHVAKMKAAAGEPIVSEDLPKVVEVTTDRLKLPESLGKDILSHLIKGGDFSRWGLLNAVTATANTHDDYETSTLLERAGGQILELPSTDWRAISNAA